MEQLRGASTQLAQLRPIPILEGSVNQIESIIKDLFAMASQLEEAQSRLVNCRDDDCGSGAPEPGKPAPIVRTLEYRLDEVIQDLHNIQTRLGVLVEKFNTAI